MYWSALSSNFSQIIIDVKNQFEGLDLLNHEMIAIRDEAPAISEIDINITVGNNTDIYTMRLIFEGEDGSSKVRFVEKGDWKIVYVQKI